MIQRPQQDKFVADFISPNLDFTGGNRCGKTFGGVRHSVLGCAINPGEDLLVIEPTFEMAVTNLFPDFKKYQELYNVEMAWKGKPYDYYYLPRFNSKILIRSADKPERLEGGNFWGVWPDEPDQMKSNVFERIITRANSPTANFHQVFTTGTFEGIGAYYKYINTPNHRVIKGSIEEIVSNTYPGYIQKLKDNFTNLKLRQKLFGEAVDTTSGKVYYAFNNKYIIKSYTPDYYLPLWVCCDFNINPCGWVLCQFKDGKVYIFDEITMYDANIPSMCKKVIERKPEKFPALHIYIDYTSIKRRDVAASYSSLEIIRSYFESHRNYRENLKNNPRVIDRVDVVNNLFEKDKVRIVENCTEVLKDCRQNIWSTLKPEIDKNKDKERTHWMDAFGYAACYEFFDELRIV